MAFRRGRPANTMAVGLVLSLATAPMSTPFSIQRIDTRNGDVRAALDALRQKLSPAGNVVSEAGRRRTIEVFGEPLSPQQVVERICGDVQATRPGGGAGVFSGSSTRPN